MLQRKKIGSRLHCEAIQPANKWLSLQRPIGQVGCQSCKGGNDDVLGGLSNHESKLIGEQTLFINKNLKQNQNSLFLLNEPGLTLKMVKMLPNPYLTWG